MNNFITNDDSKELKERLLELIHVSKELKFLVGFFYFSGIQELYQGLKENPDVILKVLVGMNIDTANFKLLEFAEYGNNTSDSDKSEKLLGDIRLSLAHEDFDTPTFYKQIAFIIDLIQKDRLIIRKTRDPNHAKIYFFHTTEKAKSKLFITGSSNLTRPALTTQAEFNVEISDYGAKETEAYFDALWDDAVKITERDEVKLKLIKVIEKGTLVRKITPF
ncbi:MAG TPA: phospholipase D-like domain-containing protein [Anaerolineaceae bacterium]|nr:phospholipase D-like domain-containing protein [Anaerolineaceae bacterium]